MFTADVYNEVFARVAEVKAHREAFEADLASGSFSIAEVFERASADPVLAGMKVLPAIEALPETGKVSTRRAFGDLGISEAGLISDVNDDQIAALPEAIESHTR